MHGLLSHSVFIMLDFITVVIYGKAEPQLALTSPCPWSGRNHLGSSPVLRGGHYSGTRPECQVSSSAGMSLHLGLFNGHSWETCLFACICLLCVYMYWNILNDESGLSFLFRCSLAWFCPSLSYSTFEPSGSWTEGPAQSIICASQGTL